MAIVLASSAQHQQDCSVDGGFGLRIPRELAVMICHLEAAGRPDWIVAGRYSRRLSFASS
jgi:hypothetical protein